MFFSETNGAIKEEGSVSAMERVQKTSCTKLLHHDINAERTVLFSISAPYNPYFL